MFESGLGGIGADAGGSLPNPLADTSVGIVVETVHTAGTHAFFEHIAVPAFPDGGGAVVHGIEPAGVLPLEEKFIGDIRHPVFGQGGHQYGCPGESCLKAVSVGGEVLFQSGDHRILGIPLHQMVLQGEQSRCLHGIQNGGLESAAAVQEGLLQVGFGICDHLLIFRGIPTGGGGHVAHHPGIYHPIGCSQITPV